MMGRLMASLVSILSAATLALSAPAAAQPSPAAADRQEVLVLVRLPPEHYRPNAVYGAGYGDESGRAAERRLAGRIARAHGLTLVDDWPMPLLGLDCFVMAAPSPQTAEQAAEELSRDPDVAWSQPMHVYRAEGGPARGDPLFRAQPAAREWRLAELHRIATGRGVLVAVIDSKVQADHPDLAGQVAASADFAPVRAHGAEQHGTAVAGIIAANADDGIGIAGIAPQAKLLALRACWQQSAPAAGTVCDTLSLAKALHFAIERGAQVINLSLAGPPDLLLGKLVDLALTRGATVVGAYDTRLSRGGFPASHAGVIAVAEESMARLPAGVYTAPGRDVPTTEPGGRWSLVDGSSYAAAHVSGLAALARQRVAGGGLVLVAARSGGGAIDACTTLSRTLRPCGPAIGGETRISLRR
jgi:hypothetical protein